MANLWGRQTMQAVPLVLEMFDTLIPVLKPSYILELGTGHGGLTLYLYMWLRIIPHKCSLMTIDIHQYESFPSIPNLTHLIGNFNDPNMRAIYSVPLAQKGRGAALVLCDGGTNPPSDKLSQACAIAPLLHKGDIIMTHDFGSTAAGGLTALDLCKFEEKYGLTPYRIGDPDKAQTSGWTCSRKE